MRRQSPVCNPGTIRSRHETHQLTLIVNLALVPRVLLERPPLALDQDLSQITYDDSQQPNVLHPAGSQGVGLATRDAVDKDERVDDGESRVVARDKGSHGERHFAVGFDVGPPDLRCRQTKE